MLNFWRKQKLNWIKIIKWNKEIIFSILLKSHPELIKEIEKNSLDYYLEELPKY